MSITCLNASLNCFGNGCNWFFLEHISADLYAVSIYNIPLIMHASDIWTEHASYVPIHRHGRCFDPYFLQVGTCQHASGIRGKLKINDEKDRINPVFYKIKPSFRPFIDGRSVHMENAYPCFRVLFSHHHHQSINYFSHSLKSLTHIWSCFSHILSDFSLIYISNPSDMINIFLAYPSSKSSTSPFYCARGFR